MRVRAEATERMSFTGVESTIYEPKIDVDDGISTRGGYPFAKTLRAGHGLPMRALTVSWFISFIMK